MRKAGVAAILSIGILGGMSGSARAQQFNPCPLYSVIGADGVCRSLLNMQENGGITGSGGFRSAVPPAPAAMGQWCVVGPPSLPHSLRQLPAPGLAVGTQCMNYPSNEMGRVQ